MKKERKKFPAIPNPKSAIKFFTRHCFYGVSVAPPVVAAGVLEEESPLSDFALPLSTGFSFFPVGEESPLRA
jgi:hypothetical protein